MNKALAVARKEFAASFKDRVFLIMALLFLVMSVASVYIGSATKRAELSAYDSIVQAAVADGDSVPEAPQIFELAILRNIIQYIIMLGAVLAIFLGFDAFSGERDAGTLRVILARPISRAGFLLGKLIGATWIMGLLLIVTFAFNLMLFALFTGLMPSASEVARLAAFMLTALMYMLCFYAGALLTSILARERSYAFLIMMIVWIFVSFVVPQLADTQRSFAYALSGASGIVTVVPSDTAISGLIELCSPAVQFQRIGNDLLQTVAESANLGLGALMVRRSFEFFYIIVSGAALLALCLVSAGREEAL